MALRDRQTKTKRSAIGGGARRFLLAKPLLLRFTQPRGLFHRPGPGLLLPLPRGRPDGRRREDRPQYLFRRKLIVPAVEDVARDRDLAVRDHGAGGGDGKAANTVVDRRGNGEDRKIFAHRL